MRPACVRHSGYRSSCRSGSGVVAGGTQGLHQGPVIGDLLQPQRGVGRPRGDVLHGINTLVGQPPPQCCESRPALLDVGHPGRIGIEDLQMPCQAEGDVIDVGLGARYALRQLPEEWVMLTCTPECGTRRRQEIAHTGSVSAIESLMCAMDSLRDVPTVG